MQRILVVVACLIAIPRPVRADEADPGIGATGKAAFIVELLVPDFRLERSFTEDTTRYTLAVPFAVHAGNIETGSTFVGFNHIAEIQYVIGDNVWRGSVAERILFGKSSPRVMPLVELGGVFGSDGYGGTLATGLQIGDAGMGSHIAVVVRAVLTDREVRGDVGFDFQIPITVF